MPLKSGIEIRNHGKSYKSQNGISDCSIGNILRFTLTPQCKSIICINYLKRYFLLL